MKHCSEEVQRCIADAARGAHDKTVTDATAKLLAPPAAASASSGASTSAATGASASANGASASANVGGAGVGAAGGAVGGEAPAVFEDDVARATAAAAVAKQTQKKLNGTCAAQHILKISFFRFGKKFDFL